MTTYYEILGIPESAHITDIKRAYRRLAKEHHPDVSDSERSHERFIMIEKAYSTLSDPIKRKHYDNGLAYLRERRKDRKSVYHQRDVRREFTEEQKKAIWLNKLMRLNEDKAYYQKFVKYRWMSVIMGLCLASLFIVDDLSSSLGDKEFISEIRLQYPMTKDLKDVDYYIVYTPNNTYRLHHRLASELV